MSLVLDSGDGRRWRASQTLELINPATTADLSPRAGEVLRPGEVNAHTHLYSGLAPLSMPPPPRAPRGFVELLQLVWWRLDRALDQASLRASARYALAEALLWGTTALIDHHESPNLIEGSLELLADAAQELGVRLVVTYGATERNFGRAEATRGLAECERFLKSNRRPLVRGLVGLHASFTVSDETIREAGALARRLGVGLHVHLAEDDADLADAKRRGYSGPLERLLELDALPRGSVLAHGVHLTAAQVKRVEQAGLWLVQNPRSNEGNQVGYPTALGESGLVALGTDGWPADMPAERAALLRLGREHGDSEAVLGARAAGGQLLLGELFRQRFSALEEGAAADVCLGVPGARPRHVVIAGRQVVRDGKLLTADLEQIHAEARAQAPRLWEKLQDQPVG